ncbi:MATE family efflux transporter [Faecalibacillus intestinalis]
MGLANGLSIVIAQKIGSKQRTEVKKAMINGLYIMIVLFL